MRIQRTQGRRHHHVHLHGPIDQSLAQSPLYAPHQHRSLEVEPLDTNEHADDLLCLPNARKVVHVPKGGFRRPPCRGSQEPMQEHQPVYPCHRRNTLLEHHHHGGDADEPMCHPRLRFLHDQHGMDRLGWQRYAQEAPVHRFFQSFPMHFRHKSHPKEWYSSAIQDGL